STGASKATREQVAAVVEKLNRLFQAYRPAPKDENEAFLRFAEQAEAAVAKMPEVARDYWEKQLPKRKTWSVKRQPFRDAHTRVKDTLSPKEEKSAIFLGEIKALNRADECWAIEHVGGFGALAGYVDVQTGRLELLWLIPEG